jgi:hypothetical protein
MMMDMLNLVESVPRMVATEAINYCMRALSQVGTPIEVQRDYFHDTASSKPTPEAVDLAKTILSKIEDEEGIDLDHLDVRKAEMYICELGIASDELILRMEGFNRERGAELVRQLFYSEP